MTDIPYREFIRFKEYQAERVRLHDLWFDRVRNLRVTRNLVAWATYSDGTFCQAITPPDVIEDWSVTWK